MHYTYLGLRDWAIMQYSLRDTVREIEARADKHRMEFGANKPVELASHNIFPNGLQLDYLLFKDILKSDRKTGLPLKGNPQLECTAEASYDPRASQAPYRLEVRLPYAEQPLEPILSDFASLLPPTKSWIVGMQQPKPTSSHARVNMDTLLKRNNLDYHLAKRQWDDVTKEEPRLQNEGGDGDIYQCTTGPRAIGNFQRVPDAMFNRIVLTTPKGLVKYQYLQVIADLRAETATPLIAACGIVDKYIGYDTTESKS